MVGACLVATMAGGGVFVWQLIAPWRPAIKAWVKVAINFFTYSINSLD
jgi:hypothetical protein